MADDASNLHMLVPHPAMPPKSVEAVKVQLSRSGDTLWLEYSVHAVAGALLLPEAPAQRGEDGRADGLWQSTCLELFVQPVGSDGYLEFNFSPSFQWAAYQFSGYRADMRNWTTHDPDLWASADPGEWYFLSVEDLPELPQGPLRIGLSAVIEETDGTKSYWALAHPGEAPDFHDSCGWTINL